MALKRMMHYSTLSSESKQTLQSGNLKKMLSQLSKLQLLCKKGTAITKGSLHRHVVAMKEGLIQHKKQLTGNIKKLTEMLKHAVDTAENANFTEANDFCEQFSVKNEWESLSKRHMRNRKQLRFNWRRRVKAVISLEEVIYKHYYLKLTELTKMRESLPTHSYTARAIARSNGMCLDSYSLYKDRFRNLLFKVLSSWRPRDFIQRMIGSEKMHSLCIKIIHYISVCTSPGIDILENMEIIDNFFRILRRFKISSPVFRRKRIYQGGGPKKCIKNDEPEAAYCSKENAIGKGELHVKVVNSLSAILKGQFNLEHGLGNVRKLYKASKMTGSVSHKLKGYNIQTVPTGSSTVQIHYCDNHYVTSHQSQSGIEVWDSVQTSEQFKVALYPQLQLTYGNLSQYQYSDLPDGLITYKMDNRNMQKDTTSCGIFAVMRAFFILSNTSSKINTDIARSYLSSVLVKYEFSDYDLFSSRQRNVQMQVIMENYLSDQKELLLRKVTKSTCESNKTTLSEVTKKAVGKPGRPQKRKYSKVESEVVCDSGGPSVKKRGRPAKLSPEEKTKRIKDSKLKHKRKGMSPEIPIKKGRPSQYSPEEKVKKNREKSLRHYHKSTKDNTKENVQKQREKHKKNLKQLRSSATYKEHEQKKDRERHGNKRANPENRDKERQWIKDMRDNPAFRGKERDKDRVSHREMRENPQFTGKERQWIRDMREIPEFRDKERDKDRISHRDMRENPEFRDKERDKDRATHREMRENLQFTEKERQWIRDMREIPEFRDKERDKDRISHRDMRENPELAERERQWIRDMRENPGFRNNERDKDRDAHREMRENPEFRDKERDKDRDSHRKMRKNPEFTEKERQWIRDMRENPAFRSSERDKDRDAHKEMRRNPVFRGKEREKDTLSHREMRENPQFRGKERDKDREWHEQNRADPLRRERENAKAYRRRYGENEQEAIRKYLAAIQTGPSVVCTCCLQLWFPDNCTALERLHFSNDERVGECKTGTLFEGKEWLCSTCIRHLRENRIPPISQANGMKFYDVPKELELVQMEERCIALRQPFFQIRELPNGGQRSIKGNVVNVPMDVAKTIDALPRDLNETETIGIKFKKKVAYKKCEHNENIRPQVVIKAAKYLIANSELYQAHNVKINEAWQEEINDTDDSLKTLMGFHNSDNNDINELPGPDIIEIDLTMSDDDVTSIDSSSCDHLNVICSCDNHQGDSEEVKIKHEKRDTGLTILHQVESPVNDKAQLENPESHGKNSTADRENEDDTFSEVDPMENFSGNMDTLLDSPVILAAKATHIVEEQSGDNTNTMEDVSTSSRASHVITDADALVIAPGEGQHPISLFNDPDAEYLAFPSIYCGRRRPIDNECKSKKKPSKADVYKWECRAQDRRVATCIPDLFFKYKSLQIEAVENVVGISMRKVKGKRQPTAGELRTSEGRNKLINLNEGYSLYSRMRNTPPYYSHKKKNLLAVVRQEGMPALFFTQSCADTRWPELLKVLGKLIDGKDYTDVEVENMSPIHRNRLVAADPVTVVRYFENKCHKFQQHIMNLRGSSRRFLRREFQNRGSPHSHEIHWVDGAPVYDPDRPENDKNVTEFIDSWISTKIEVSPEEETYLKYQIHRHSTSCRKRGEAICRFGIPFFPMKTTCILKPLECDEVDQLRLESLKNAYKELRNKLNDMGEGLELTHEEFLERIQMSETDYILTIRSSLNTAKVFYQRRPNALRVNPYMKGMLAVIKANHDVQYPLNIYALVCYVADYLLKSQKGLSATLEQAVRDTLDGDMTVKQQIRHIGYNLIGAIETSAPEAAYYIMQIPFTYCSVEVVFIPTCLPEDRLHVLKSEQELSELPNDSRDVLKSNKIAAYARRPKQLEGMCLADYVAELNVQYDKDQGQDQGEHDKGNDDYEHDEDIIEQVENCITEDIFPLKVGSATFKKRKQRRVIRFVNYHRLRDEENFCREKLLLYKPWRKEEVLMGKHDSYRGAFDEHEHIIRHNMIKYEEYTEEVEEAEEVMETVQNEEFDEIAPTTEQEEMDAELIGPTDSSDYRFFRPPKQGELEQSATDVLYEAGVSGTVDVNVETMSRFLSEDKYLNMVRSLNEKQFQVYTHVMNHVSKGNPDPLHIFITGVQE